MSFNLSKKYQKKLIKFTPFIQNKNKVHTNINITLMSHESTFGKTFFFKKT